MKSRSLLLRLAALASILSLATGAANAVDLTVTGVTALPEDTLATYGAVTIESGGTLDIGGGSFITVTGLVDIKAGGTILVRGKNVSSQVNAAWAGVGSTLSAQDLHIAETGTISANGQGYINGAGPGVIAAGGDHQSGASYGGLGIWSSGTSTKPYGSALQPTELGSAGGRYGADQAAAGGALHLIVSNALVHNGTITASGAASGTYTASGTGGSLWVETGILSGKGTFNADAGPRNNSNAACSGGRVAVYYRDASAFSGFAGSSANPTPNTQAERGTVAFVDTAASPKGDLHVFQRVTFDEDALPSFHGVTVEAGGLMELGGASHLTVDDLLEVKGTGVLLCRGKNVTGKVAGAWAGTGVELNAARVSIAAGGLLSANGQGYVNGSGPGFDSATTNWETGASHGGLGDTAYGNHPATYGSQLEPVAFGSSGGRYGSDQSSGGGAIKLTVSGTLILNGAISADGAGSGTYTTGGTGGSLWIRTGTLSGTGKFTADAGPRNNSRSSCSGGRVAVYYHDASGFTGFATSTVNPTAGSTSEKGTVAFLNIAVPNKTDLTVYQRVVYDPDAVASFENVTVEAGGVLDLGGGAAFSAKNTLTVKDGGTVLCRGKNTTAKVSDQWAGAGVSIEAAQLTVAANGVITADGLGYENGSGPGYTGTLGSQEFGASYGGVALSANGNRPNPYGDAYHPLDLGSAGGRFGADTSAGGGAIRLTVTGTLRLNGLITANGTSAGTYSAGGTGGSIWVTAGTLTGSGQLTANASVRRNSNGVCSGGRIAVYFADASTFSGFAASTANGTSGIVGAPAGTAGFFDTSVARTHLRIFQRWRTEQAEASHFGRLTLDNGAVYEVGGEGTLHLDGTLELLNGSTLRTECTLVDSPPAGAWTGKGAFLHAADVTISADSKITATGKGYRNGGGPGGPGTDFNLHGAGGSSYGGRGYGAATGPIYGSLLQPETPGSAGGRYSIYEETAGGGVIHLSVDGTLTLDGNISADGVATGTYHAGATGGSVWVETTTLQGSGLFTANGATSNNTQAQSAGGRVAVYFNEGSHYTGFVTSSANAGGAQAQKGSVIFVDKSVSGYSLLSNQRLSIETDATLSLANLKLDHGALLEVGGGSKLIVSGTLEVTGNSQLVVHSKNLAAPVADSWAGTGGTIETGTLLVAAGSRITADGEGYKTGNGPGAPLSTADHSNGGASYGGSGVGAKAGGVYGSALEPASPGSAGRGYSSTDVAAGGGAIRLIADILKLDGTVTANGTDFGTYIAGATGGSIWVTTRILSGSGTFSADAAPSHNTAAASGGGRIAVHYADAKDFTGLATSTATHGSLGAADGTVLFLDTTVPHFAARIPQHFSVEPNETVNLGSLSLEPGALIDLGGGGLLHVDGLLNVGPSAVIQVHSINNQGPVDGRWLGRGGAIDAGQMTLATGSKITANGHGYVTRQGPGSPGAASNHESGGASFGGTGVGALAGTVYGVAELPAELGSAGAIYSGEQTQGGGAVRIDVSGALILDGAISADGVATGTYHGGATGGSILINAASIAGAGSISANAAPSSNAPSGSGGGRIALYDRNGDTLTETQVTVTGGSNGAASGTVFRSHSPAAFLSQPTVSLLHGIVEVGWGATSVDARTVSCDVIVNGTGLSQTLTADAVGTYATTWDTTNVPDALYELRVLVRQNGGAVLAETSRPVAVLNHAHWHKGALTTSETWAATGVHIIEGRVTIGAGITLTVESGAVIKFTAGGSLFVDKDGTLNLPSSAEHRTVLTDIADDSVGGDTNLDGALSLPLVGRWGGISSKVGAVIAVDDKTELRFTMNTHEGALTSDEAWLGNQVHYVLGVLTVPSGKTLTILPGAIVKFANKRGITVADNGTLSAVGSLVRPIIFTSDKDDGFGGDTNHDGNSTSPSAGDWHWLFIAGHADIAYSQILYAGGSLSGVWSGDGALRTTGNASVKLTNCLIKDAYFDGVLPWGGTVDIVNTVVVRADRGLLAHPSSVVTILNSTVDHCREGILCHGGTMSVANSIVSNCSESGIQFDFGQLSSVTYTDVWNPSPGAVNYVGTTNVTGTLGNLSRDPKFRDAGRDDFRLNYGSPAIDSANAAQAPATDFLGVARFDEPHTTNTGAGGVADMGAYEFSDTGTSQLDLAVTAVNGPGAITAGAAATVRWTISNVGSVSVTGPWRDRISLQAAGSRNAPVIPVDDAIVADGLRLGPGESATFTKDVIIPPAVEGRYRWVIDGNAKNELFEGQNTANNRGYATTATGLQVPELVTGQLLSGTFTTAGTPLLYKVKPQPGLDIALTLNRSGAGGSTRLALGRDRLPSLSDNDGASPERNEPSVTAAIAPADGSTYYLLAVPVDLPAGPLGFTLAAVVVSYDLKTLGLSSGSNRGAVTIPIEGTGLRRTAVVSLVKTGVSPLQATQVHFVDGAHLSASFDLTSTAPGLYDVRVEQDGVARTLPAAFRVNSESPGELRTAVLLPPRVRVGRQYTAWIEYQNIGHNDLALPIIGVTSSDGLPLSLAPGEGTATNLSVLALSPSGTPWVLGPGQAGKVPVYFTAKFGNNGIQTSVTTVDSEAPMNWEDIRTELRPTVNRPDTWDTYWAATIAHYGLRSGDYARWVRDAYELWNTRTGLRSHDLTPALRYALADAAASASARLEGHVFLDENAQPLAGINVGLLDESGAVAGAATSERDGFVRFTTLSPGFYLPSFDGYLAPAALAKIAVGGGGPPATTSWVLRSGGTIRGTLMVDGSIDLNEISVAATGGNGAVSAASGVDALGRYRLTGLPEGTYTLALLGDGIVPASASGVQVSAGSVVEGPPLALLKAGTMTGSVTSAITHLPLPGASVVAVLNGSPASATVTAEDGTFALSGLTSGTWSVTANGSGFLASAARSVTLAPQGNATGVDFALTRGLALSGTVTSGGHPVVNAFLAIGDGIRILGTASTGADGSYEITGLPEGTWNLKVEHPSFAESSTHVTLVAGTVNTDQVVLTNPLSVGARVHANGTDRGVPGTALRLIGPDGTITYAYTDAAGNLTLGRLNDGVYHLSLQDGAQRKTFTVASGVVVADLDFSLVTGSIHGRVYSSAGHAAPPLLVHLLAGGEEVASVQSSPTGDYAFHQLAPGSYTVRFSSFDAFYAPTAAVLVEADGTAEVPDAIAGDKVLEVAISGGGATLADEGVVFLSGDGALGAFGLRYAEVDSTGHARFTGLTAGSYTIEARVAGTVSPRTSVTLSTPATEASLTVSASGALTGIIRNAQGAPIPAASVHLFTGSDPAKHYEASTARDGSYAFYALPQGLYDAWFTAGASAGVYSPVHDTALAVTAGSTLTHDAVLGGGAAQISGSIATADGSYPVNAVIELRTSSGTVVAETSLGNDGTFALPAVPAGSYTLAAVSTGFAVAPQALTVTSLAPLSDLVLHATWVGGFGVLPSGSSAASRMRAIELDLPSFDGFDSAWAQTAYNAISDWLKKALGEPPFKKPNLRAPAGLYDTTCPCPEAIAAWQRSLYYQKYADLQWDQWHEYWEARQLEIFSSLGAFGANLLKLSSSLAAATLQVPKALEAAQFARKNALWKMNNFTRGSAKYADAVKAYNQAGEAIAKIERVIGNLGTPANLLSSAISNTEGGVTSYSGTLGNFQSVKNFLSDPIGTFTTDQGILAFSESVNGLVNNLSGAIGAISVLADLAGRDAFGALGPVADALGPITEAIQTVVEAARTIEALMGTPKALASLKAIYDHRIGMRDNWYKYCLELLAACRARSDCNEDPKKKPKPPKPNGGKPGGNGNSGGVGSYDPNDKTSSGIGAAGYITPDSPVYYDIHFENVATASAAAQLVTIRDALSSDLDWSTFELVSIEFNGTRVDIPSGAASFQGQTSVSSDPNPVDVSASLDPATGVVLWSLRSVDPVSGDFPEDPFAGFLPPNDASGRGEGHVSFLIRPRSGLADGASFTNQARITFDTNPPIDTPVATNTIDRSPASATIAPLSSRVGTKFIVSWNGSDSGSGVARYELWVSKDGGAFSLWSDAITTASAVFHGDSGHTYAFYVRAYDALGQAVLLTPVAQTSTLAVEGATSSRLANLSTRGYCGAGFQTMISGFVIREGSTPSAEKNFLLRAVGPTLAQPPFYVAGTLSDPALALYDNSGTAFLTNEDWSSASNANELAAAAAGAGAFPLPVGSLDAGLLKTLPAGIYTAHVQGTESGGGVALVEMYDVDSGSNDPSKPRLLNLSGRAFVGTGSNVLIAGFVIVGDAPKTVLLRAVGPTLGLEPFNVAGSLADPQVQLVDRNGGLVAENDDWESVDGPGIAALSRTVGAFPIPGGSKDAAMIATLAPGPYTLIVSGKDGGTGVAIVEIYDAD